MGCPRKDGDGGRQQPFPIVGQHPVEFGETGCLVRLLDVSALLVNFVVLPQNVFLERHGCAAGITSLLVVLLSDQEVDARPIFLLRIQPFAHELVEFLFAERLGVLIQPEDPRCRAGFVKWLLDLLEITLREVFSHVGDTAMATPVSHTAVLMEEDPDETRVDAVLAIFKHELILLHEFGAQFFFPKLVGANPAVQTVLAVALCGVNGAAK